MKISPIRGIRTFRERGKLSPRYIGLYEVVERLNPIGYRLDLPVELEHVHNVFHISQLKKCIPNADHAIVTEPTKIAEDLAYEEPPVHILDHKISYTTSRYI